MDKNERDERVLYQRDIDNDVLVAKHWLGYCVVFIHGIAVTIHGVNSECRPERNIKLHAYAASSNYVLYSFNSFCLAQAGEGR
jgi:hypothetical protein